ncbi:hypothetical protein HDU83_004419 [Entophlyctis luteolus]|nr:hypothetical protein HDU83_004419 [Entophlyctis luteolus]
MATSLQRRPASGAARLTHRITRFAVATLFWIILTQWFFGNSILDRILNSTGTCELDSSSLQTFSAHQLEQMFSTARACIKGGGDWSGFDVSGHAFLLIHSSILIVEEIYSSDPDTTGPSGLVGKIARGVAWAFVGLWWFLLLATAIHFHHFPEKVAGSLLAIAFWIAEFKLTSNLAS